METERQRIPNIGSEHTVWLISYGWPVLYDWVAWLFELAGELNPEGTMVFAQYHAVNLDVPHIHRLPDWLFWRFREQEKAWKE